MITHMSGMNAWGIYSRGIPGCKLTGLGFVGGRLGVCAVGATGGPQRVTRGTGWVLSLEPLHWGVGGGTGHALCGGLWAEKHSAHRHGAAPEGVPWKAFQGWLCPLWVTSKLGQGTVAAQSGEG